MGCKVDDSYVVSGAAPTNRYLNLCDATDDCEVYVSTLDGYISPSRAERWYAVRLIREKFPHLDAQTIAYRLRFSTFVSMEHKILYVETPKAGCSTIKYILRDALGAPPIDFPVGSLWESRRDMFVHTRSNVPLPSLIDLDDALQRHVLTSPDFLRFCVVRNPYSRLISAWRNKIVFCEPGYEYVYKAIIGNAPPIHGKQILDFEKFLEYVEKEPNLAICNPHWRRQVDLLFESAIPYNHIGRLERLSETISILGSYIPTVRQMRAEARNQSFSHDGGSDLGERIASRIFELYKADFIAYGYAENSWVNVAGFEIKNSPVPYSRLLDEVTERNMVLSILYERYRQLQSRHDNAYRYSMRRIQNVVAKVFRRLLRA